VTIVDLTARKNAAGASANGAAVALTPPVLNLDDEDSPSDVVDLLFLDAFARGVQPHARNRNVCPPQAQRRPCARRAPGRCAPCSGAATARSSTPATAGPCGCAAGTTAPPTWPVTAVDAATADRVIEQSIRGAIRPAPPRSEAVPVGLLAQAGRAPDPAGTADHVAAVDRGAGQLRAGRRRRLDRLMS
jgi:hypothetical protein